MNQLLDAGPQHLHRHRGAVVQGGPIHLADAAGGDRFAAVASGLIGLAYGAAGRFGGGKVNEVIVEMDNALLLVTGISDGSALGVVADANCDIGFVGYEMAVLVEKAGRVLTPELRAQLVSSLPR